MTPAPQPHEWIISDKDYHIALEYFHFEAKSLKTHDNDIYKGFRKIVAEESYSCGEIEHIDEYLKSFYTQE